MTLNEIFATAEQKVSHGEYWHQDVTASEWASLMPEAFAPEALHFSPDPSLVLDGELKLIHPVLRRGIHLTVTDVP